MKKTTASDRLVSADDAKLLTATAGELGLLGTLDALLISEATADDDGLGTDDSEEIAADDKDATAEKLLTKLDGLDNTARGLDGCALGELPRLETTLDSDDEGLGDKLLANSDDSKLGLDACELGDRAADGDAALDGELAEDWPALLTITEDAGNGIAYPATGSLCSRDAPGMPGDGPAGCPIVDKFHLRTTTPPLDSGGGG